MGFHLHDSLTDALIPLPERTPGETSLYVCGPTVYGYIHVGNARPPVVFDVLTRHLRAQGRKVTMVHNFTDVDDRIIQVAVAENVEPKAVTERYIAAYKEEMAALLCVAPDVEPRVSEHIPAIVTLIEALIEKGSAYATPEGDVYYDVTTFPTYGKLSKRKLESQRGDLGRGKSGEGKRGDHDFALWKAAKPNEPVGVRWPSPWGEGRPGWHIECSAMAHAHLGDGFDLHGGGQDLKFPHHENEIAQSEPVYGSPMARGWMHNGFIEVDVLGGEYPESVRELIPALVERDPLLAKISKSDAMNLAELRARPTESLTPEDLARMAVLARKVAVGEFFQLRRLRTRVDGEAIRLWMLGTHYRSPLAFDVAGEGPEPSFPALEQAERRLEYYSDTRVRVTARVQALGDAVSAKIIGPTPAGVRFFEEAQRSFDASLDDDLNTAGALDPLARVYERANKLCDQKKTDAGELRAAAAAIAHLAAATGVADGDPEAFFKRVTARRIAARGVEASAIDKLVADRVAARNAKDFARADALRGELTALGIELRDGAQGTSWRATQ